MIKLDIAKLISKAERSAKAFLAGLPVTLFLGENPLASSLIFPGTADKTKKRLAGMVYQKDPGAVHRAEKLYDAWISFYRGETDRAHLLAVQIFEDIGKIETKMPPLEHTDEMPAYAQKLGAAYLICSLARYGMPGHHTDAAVTYMKALKESGLHIAQAAEIDLAMYEMSIGIMSDIPAWIREGEFGVGRMGDSLLFGDDGVYPENIYAAVLSAVQYKNYHGDYMKSLALIDTAEKVYGMGHVIIGDIYFALYRALNCKALGFPDETDASLKRAIQLAQKDGLWQIISQFYFSFDERLPRIMQETDPDGYARCKMLSDGLIDRIKKSHEEEKEKRGYRKLSSQELEVIRLAAAGRKNKEIAKELHIEVVTVKYHRQNARNKLGISAQADTSEIKEALERYEVSASWI